MFAFVAVLCVLCVFVVNPFPSAVVRIHAGSCVALHRPLHGPTTEIASMWGNVGVFSTPPQRDIFNVIKCNHFMAQCPLLL